jgi:hypothetical protein
MIFVPGLKETQEKESQEKSQEKKADSDLPNNSEIDRTVPSQARMTPFPGFAGFIWQPPCTSSILPESGAQLERLCKRSKEKNNRQAHHSRQSSSSDQATKLIRSDSVHRLGHLSGAVSQGVRISSRSRFGKGVASRST